MVTRRDALGVTRRNELRREIAAADDEDVESLRAAEEDDSDEATSSFGDDLTLVFVFETLVSCSGFLIL